MFLSDTPYYWDASPDSFVINAYVKDDIAVESVEFIFEDTTEPVTLFDDGIHKDKIAGDGIYGNILFYNPIEPTSSIFLKVNKLGIPFSNKGVVASVAVTDTIISTFQLADVENNDVNIDQKLVVSLGYGGKYEEGFFLFAAGFFLSGYSNGNMWTNAVASASLVEDYLPGKVGSAHNDPLNKIYAIYKDDPPFGRSWQYWKDAVSLGAEFYDGDRDGNYNPVDKNWNG